MNRTQKKCVIAAAGMHLLLVVILIVGPAFLSSSSKQDNLDVINFIPANLIDKPFSGGGEKNPTPAATVPPAPQQATVTPTPQPKVDVTPPAPVPKPTEQPKIDQPVAQKDVPKPTPKPDPDALTTKPAKAKPQVSTTLVTRKPSSTPTKSNDDTAAAAAAKQRASDIAKAARSLRQGLSSSTAIDTPAGFGGGGEAYASYAQVVKSIYDKVWIEPSDTASDDAITKATVTIANDGTVISASITQPSGDTQADASVQRALDHVAFVAPFPASMTEKQHTFIINFSLKAKKLSA